MNIVIPIVSAAPNISGVQRHAINLARCLLQFPQVQRIHLIAGEWQRYLTEASPEDPRLQVEFLPAGNTVVGRNLWYYAQLPGICNDRRADIVHLPYPVPFRSSSFHAPVAVTLHDMYPFDVPQNFGFPKVLFNRQVLLRCLQDADAIACVSNSTLQRLERLEPRLALTKAAVIPNAVERMDTEAVQPSAIAAGDRFLLCVAQHRRNKNILLLLRSYLRLRGSDAAFQHTRLVIVGVNGPETSSIQRFIHSHALHAQVMLLAGLSEGELQWCYRHCAALVVPSTVEGFGLPIAEGLLAGCRIVCSDIPTFREVGGDHCRYTSLAGDAVHHLASAIANIVKKPPPQPVLMPQLTHEAIGRQYLRLYASLRHGRHAVVVPGETQACT